MFNRMKYLTGAILIATVVTGVQTAGAAPRSTESARQSIGSAEKDRAGRVWPRLRRFLVLIGFSDDMVGPRP
jgi:hypothetical protein